MIDLDDAVMHGYADSNGVKIHYPSLGKGQLVVLSLNARYDSRLAEPMHNYCRNLTEERQFERATGWRRRSLAK
jgi:hypothetical protein